MGLGSKSDHLLSKIATNDRHGENSPYFVGWKAYEKDPFHPTENPGGVIQMGLAKNQLCFNLIEEWIKDHPKASICTLEGVHQFKDIAIFQDYHGLPAFTNLSYGTFLFLSAPHDNLFIIFSTTMHTA